jgi:hypothetical protein
MNLKSKWLLVVVGVGMGFLAMPARAMATAYFTLNPTSGSYTTGSTFDVVMGVNSGTEKVIGLDIKATFDASKLEVESIVKGSVPDDGYQFTYTNSSPIIDNSAGTFEVTLPSANSSVYTGVVANHELLKITFKAKATGTAALNYVCTAGSVAETNIINDSGNDVVACGSNQSGSYTITATSSSSVTSTPTLTPTPTSTSSTTSSTSAPTSTSTATLPETGGAAETMALVILGFSSMVAALYLKLI